ncbi:MAG: hypothetical protein WA624_17930, partial [Methylocella sp.]
NEDHRYGKGFEDLIDRFETRLFFPPRSFMGSCQTPVKKTIFAEPSGGGLRCVPSFSTLKTMTSLIFVSQYNN